MNIVFFGTPLYVIPILQTLQEHFSVLVVVTAPDKKTGRKQQLTPSPVKTYLQDKITVLTPEQFNNETIEQLQSLSPDLFVVAAYGKILPAEVLAIPRHGTLCVHPSLLPKYRGPSPIPQTLLDGEKITGTTIFKMDEKIDHGPILRSEKVTLHHTETYGSLLTRLFQLGADMLPEIINRYTSGTLKLLSQDDSQATFTKLITKKDGYIDLEHPPKTEQLEQMIRAYYPWPGVWLKTRIPPKGTSTPGVLASSRWRFTEAAQNQELRIKFLPEKKIQVEGKKPVSYKDFLNGYPQLEEKLKNILN